MWVDRYSPRKQFRLAVSTHIPNKAKGEKVPLKKSSSKKAFEHNVRAEMKSGKPARQAVAIAYSVKREAKKKNK